jgi:hypothetical protein
MNLRNLLTALGLITVSVFAQTVDKIPVAINDFKGESVDQSSVRIITDRLRSELVNTGVFRVMERGEMETILKEQGFQQSGSCDDQACLVEVGQLLGVKRMVAGSIGKLGTLYTISVRMINVESGEILFAANEDCKCSIEDLVTGPVNRIVQKLSAKSTGGTPPAVPPAAAPPADTLGDLKVTSTPAGAQVKLNSTLVGATPYQSDKLKPGSYQLGLELQGYKSKTEQIVIAVAKPLALDFSLTKAKTARVSGKGKTIRKIVFGSLTAVCTAAGFFANTQVDRTSRIYSEQMNYDQSAHNRNWENVMRNVRVRNAAYIAAGAMAVGLGVSFVF